MIALLLRPVIQGDRLLLVSDLNFRKRGYSQSQWNFNL